MRKLPRLTAIQGISVALLGVFLWFGTVFILPVQAGFLGNVAKMFKAGMVLMDVVSGSNTPNVLHGMNNMLSSLFTSVLVQMVGGDNMTDLDKLEEEQPNLYREYIENVPMSMRKGAIRSMQDTTDVALGIFTNVQASDVYLEAFVPGVLRRPISSFFDSNTTIEAGTAYFVGDPPAPENAYEYFQHLWGPLWLGIFKAVTGLFVIVLIVVGMLMIFNYKIKGQTPISLYIVLRNLVIGFIGAAMSFAFGAFFFNLSKFFLYAQAQLVTGVYSSIVGEQVDISGRYNIFNPGTFMGLPRLINAFFGNFEGNKDQLFIFFPGSILGQWRISFYTATTGEFIDTIKFDQAGVDIGGDSANPLDLIGWLIGFLVGSFWRGVLITFLGAMLLFAIVKMFFFIIGNYLDMGLTMVFGPLTFLAGVIPGNEGAIWGWFRKMFARSLAPALAYLIINMGLVIITLPFLTAKGVQGVAVLTGGALKPPIFSAQNIMGYFVPISLVLIYVAYNLALSSKDMVDQVLQVQKNQIVGAALAKTPLIGKWLGSKK